MKKYNPKHIQIWSEKKWISVKARRREFLELSETENEEACCIQNDVFPISQDKYVFFVLAFGTLTYIPSMAIITKEKSDIVELPSRILALLYRLQSIGYRVAESSWIYSNTKFNKICALLFNKQWCWRYLNIQWRPFAQRASVQKRKSIFVRVHSQAITIIMILKSKVYHKYFI